MNDENKPNGIQEGRVSKLKKRRRQVNENNLGVSREKLSTILDVSRSESAKQQRGAASDEPRASALESASQGDTSKLGFVIRMNQSDLQSVMSSIVGDIQQYTKLEFEQAMGDAFEYRFKRHKSGLIDESKRKLLDHPLLGIIDLSGASTSSYCPNDGGLSVAFPLPHCAERAEKNDKDDCLVIPFDLEKPTGNGTRIPISVCQFPGTNEVETHEQIGAACNQIMSNVQEEDTLQEASGIAKLERSSRDNVVDKECNSEGIINESRDEHKNYQGKIRIESSIGASIREVFDIDNSRHVIGKLKYGDERYYLEKRMLPPPPISVDDSDDEECVSVMRYKIVLNEPADNTGGFTERDESGRLVGWISDRGRLANDTYKILREI